MKSQEGTFHRWGRLKSGENLMRSGENSQTCSSRDIKRIVWFHVWRQLEETVFRLQSKKKKKLSKRGHPEGETTG